MIYVPSHGAVMGAWLGAWPMPLDWERPWQVGRARRFGTKGLAITFVSSASDSDVLNQDNVPIVEPEIILDGEHGIERTLNVAEKVWYEAFFYLAENNVLFEGILLKPSMVSPVAEHREKASAEAIAHNTLELNSIVSPGSCRRSWRDAMFGAGEKAMSLAGTTCWSSPRRPAQLRYWGRAAGAASGAAGMLGASCRRGLRRRRLGASCHSCRCCLLRSREVGGELPELPGGWGELAIDSGAAWLRVDRELWWIPARLGRAGDRFRSSLAARGSGALVDSSDARGWKRPGWIARMASWFWVETIWRIGSSVDSGDARGWDAAWVDRPERDSAWVDRPERKFGAG